MASLSTGRVSARAISIWFRNFPAFAMIGLAIESPIILYVFLSPADTQYRTSWYFVATFAGPFVLGWITSGAVAYGVFQNLRGQPVTIGECLTTGLRRLLPVLAVALVSAIVLVATFVAAVWALSSLGSREHAAIALLALIPTLLVLTVVWLTIPVAVVEHAGVGRSLARSAFLTSGSRLQIFLVVVFFLGLVYGTWGVGGHLLGRAAVRLVGSSDEASRNVLTVQLMLRAIMDTLGATAPCVAYYELRMAKEDVDADQLAAVFD